MPSVIDTHAHIYDERFTEDLDEMIARARDAGVEAIVVPATKPAEFPLVDALVERYPMVRAAVGVHPHHAAEIDDADLAEVERRAGSAIAIGEIGLDYYYDFAPKDRQHDVFRHQLRIAKRTGLPAIVHNRESDDDLLRIIEEEQDGSLRFQLHCFSSSVEILRRALDLSAMISFTGNITFAKSTLDEAVRAVPDDRLMIETDAPYMTPVPYRGRRNEPAHVGLVAEKMALLRGESLETIKDMTTRNARRFFNLATILLALLGIVGQDLHAQGKRPKKKIDSSKIEKPAVSSTRIEAVEAEETLIDTPVRERFGDGSTYDDTVRMEVRMGVSPDGAERETVMMKDASDSVRAPVLRDARATLRTSLPRDPAVPVASTSDGFVDRRADTPGTTRRPPAPIRGVDTTAGTIYYDRIFGIGAHMASSSYISGATTLASAIGFGGWLTTAPLQPLGINWLQLDLIYTAVRVNNNPGDSAFNAARVRLGEPEGLLPPQNVHNTFDISVRFTANARALVTFFGSIGMTYFHNEYGIDRYIIESGDTSKFSQYVEDAWGISGSFGVSVNIKTGFGTIAPTGEWRAGVISGDRALEQRQDEFFISQPRFGLIFYPNLDRLFR